MPDIPLRNRAILQASMVAMIGGLALGAVAMITGVVMLLGGQSHPAGVVVLFVGAGLVVVAPLLRSMVALLARAEGNISRLHQVTLDTYEMLRRLDPSIRALSENSQISDAVRSITHRESERDALRQAIREEMYGGDWEAATYLINEMERRFGYKQEADTLRQELASVRVMTIEEKITEAASHIGKVLDERRWERARVEIERLMKLFPRHEGILALPKELARRRDAHKQELLARWKVAVQRNEIDQGIAILTELDEYLTREEARQLQESARDVFKARLLNLGVQFSLAVSEHRWRDALEIGLQIRQEFPNSRMAQEVSERIETLRVRSGFKTDVEITQKPPTTPAPA